ncbi:hypothetical protein FOZ60_006832 [Perkinsus olseni]|uniref:CCHC-type domain-containing protein n=1 Tax=Perkinsus olseni TaxID=32597 RepID=A0A7J6NMM2_PEROL|nr:hypothetical protein FOZ60_006832 [Perkinsus olseni]
MVSLVLSLRLRCFAISYAAYTVARILKAFLAPPFTLVLESTEAHNIWCPDPGTSSTSVLYYPGYCGIVLSCREHHGRRPIGHEECRGLPRKPCPTFSGDPPSGTDSYYPCLTFDRWHSRLLTYLELKGIVPPGEGVTPEQIAAFESKRTGHLKTLLRGCASSFVYSLSPADQSSYDDIMRALRNAYSMRPLVAWKTFTTRIYREQEPVDSFLASLRAYLGLADPSLSPVACDSILKLQFLLALPEDSLMYNQTMALNFATTPLNTLVQTAKNFAKGKGRPWVGGKALFMAARGKGGVPSGKGSGSHIGGASTGAKWAPANRLCWGCNQPGHMLRDCPARTLAGGMIGGEVAERKPDDKN